jgi:hypothetical protein
LPSQLCGKHKKKGGSLGWTGHKQETLFEK